MNERDEYRYAERAIKALETIAQSLRRIADAIEQPDSALARHVRDRLDPEQPEQPDEPGESVA